MINTLMFITSDFKMDTDAVKQPLYQKGVSTQSHTHKQKQVIIGLFFMRGHE